MDVYEAPDMGVRAKDDKSPVSLADERAEEFLLGELARLLPGVPVIAEENAANGAALVYADAVLLVDPVDGTRDFITRGVDFTVNIGLIRDHVPVAGAIYAPAQSLLWFGGTRAFCASVPPGAPLPAQAAWTPLSGRPRPPAGELVALASRSHLDADTSAWIAAHGVAKTLHLSSSLKFCLLAQGTADVYPRFGPTMEWDIAAGDAILRAAGGATLDPAGTPLRYALPERAYRSPSFLAFADGKGARVS